MLASTKGRYGLRMMIDIARNQDEEGKISLREIGERQGISVKYLEQLARLLCASGLLRGSRGQGGGYVLARPTDQISAGDILRATEGSTAPVFCLNPTNGNCPRSWACETVGFWRGLEDAIEAYVDGVTLADLVCECEEGGVTPGPCLGVSHRAS